MRTIQYVRAGCLIGTLGACMLMAGLAQADVTTERPGSLLIFPKVVQAGGRETIIQITNTGNNVNNLHCFYLDGEPDRNGHPRCSVLDFFISLTKQQPTHWDVSTGRSNTSAPSDGLFPGIIPPVPAGFTGALVCAEVDDGDVPTAQNKIKGEATLEGPGGDVAKYSGLAVQGNASPGANDGNNLLSLGGGSPEYNGCPTASIFNFIPDGAPDPVIEALGVAGTCTASSTDRAGLGCGSDADCVGGACTTGQSRVLNTITALPCNLDFQSAVPTTFTLGYDVIDNNEIGTTTSSNLLSCWASIDLASISQAIASPDGPLHGPYASIRITSRTGGPVLLVGETLHVDATGHAAAAAVNLHTTGLCQASGANAQPKLEFTCQTNADCPESFPKCIVSQSSTIKLPTGP